MSLVLTESELFELTGYTRAHEQAQWLEDAKIPFCRKRDGSVSVIRAWAEQAPFAIRGAAVVETAPQSGGIKMGMIGVGRKRG